MGMLIQYYLNALLGDATYALDKSVTGELAGIELEKKL